MQQILLFLYGLRAFIIFIALELLAIAVIVTHNSPQGAVFFNSSNRVTGNILKIKNDFIQYFYLTSVNETLSEKNAKLLNQVEYLTPVRDSVFLEIDSTLASNFEFLSAKVINNSIHLNQNYITLNKGSNHGIKEGMGVFNEEGVIGRVKGTSKNFSSVISILHTDLLISSKFSQTDVFGSTKWDGNRSDEAKLLYVPRHVQVKNGDEVVTSGYNAVFPEGISIGKVKDVNQGSETNYLDITLELSTDFSKLTFVYLVENVLKEEMDSLNMELGNPINDSR
ncbi:MAG: rod shape-determining protein MreC [Cyclobacteriaceae bacterium]